MSDHKIEFSVKEDETGQRLDKWISEQLPHFTRSRVQALIRDGALSRDDSVFTTISWKVRLGERYALSIPEAKPLTLEPQSIPLDVVYEDADLIVINKPAGLVVHPGAGNQDGTLVNALMAHCGDSLSGIGGVARPGIVHRLDKDTSGLLVVAKHDKAHLGLARLFSVHDIDRVYEAILIGALRPGIGTIETLIGRAQSDRRKMAVIAEEETRPDARIATTHYKTRKRFGDGRAKLAGDALASLVECTLETGRTHQIRVHMAHLGAPLIGDMVYGRGPGLSGLKPGDQEADYALRVLRGFRRQALHARKLGFVHPINGESLCFEAPPPTDFQELQTALSAL